MTVEHIQRGLLLAMAIGLTPIALSYGAAPQASLPLLYGIDASGVPTHHVFRAIMGLYLVMVCFWLAGAMRPALRVPSLWSLFVFSLGLALGRGLSLLLDGWPGPLFSSICWPKLRWRHPRHGSSREAGIDMQLPEDSQREQPAQQHNTPCILGICT